VFRSSEGRVVSRTIPLLILAAICAIVFICGAGLLVYGNTQRLIQARDWVEHTHEVLATLQSASRRVDRIESDTHLFQLTRDDNNLRTAQGAAVILQTNILHLQSLVQDNPTQAISARELRGAAEQLVRAVDSLRDAGASLPVGEILACRRLIGAIQDREQTLLDHRDGESKRSSLLTLGSGVFFVAISLVLILVLFAFLFRDAVHRQRAQQQALSINQQLADSIRNLEERAEHARLLTIARDELHLCANAADAHFSTARTVSKMLPGSAGALCVINNSRQMVEVVSTWGRPAGLPDMFPLDACCGLRSGHLRWRLPDESEIHCGHFSGSVPERYFCLPLAAHGDTLAVLYVECPTAEVAAAVDQRLANLNEFVALAAISIAGLNLRSRLENQSIRDSLTSLFNRHFMEIALDRELKRAEHHGTNLAVFMLDVDHFKQFNDAYGHEAGDSVLREVAEVFRQAVRAEDIVCRYGGEEFVIILPEITPESALERAENIRAEVGKVRVRQHGETLRQVTISIGVAMCPQSGNYLDQILRVADRSLYEAKHRGRNQTVFAEPLGVA
jgi:diguanylate cyclase (GGDEF)-like protein